MGFVSDNFGNQKTFSTFGSHLITSRTRTSANYMVGLRIRILIHCLPYSTYTIGFRKIVNEMLRYLVRI